MKLECTKNKILDAVSKAEKVTGKNLSLQVLSSIILETKKNNLIIKATNLDLGIEIIVPVKVIEDGVVAVSGSILSQFLGNLSSDDKILIESGDQEIFVHTKKTSTKIKTQNHEDFPIIPRIPGTKVIKINSTNFLKGLKSVYYSAAVTSMKPELSSIYIYSENDELIFVATDSFRLAEKRISMKGGKNLSAVLVPLKNVVEIIRNLEGSDDDVEISLSESQISFSWNGYYLVSRVIDGTFPDYKQVIPKEFKTEITLLKQDFISALKLANVFSDSFNQTTFKVIPKEKLFEISTKNADVGENHNTLEALIEGEDLTISFNYKYIVECFQSITADSVTLSFAGVGKPMCLRGVNDRSFLYIAMPMNK